MSARPVIDVSNLPETALDHRSSIWWGNVLLLMIETTMFALMVGAYFYLRGNFHSWPPPHIGGPFAALDPVPALRVPVVNLFVILLSVVPMIWADRAALRMDSGAVGRALAVCVILGGVAIALRFFEFKAVHFRWDDNAYGSVVWTIIGLHLMHLIVGTLENGLMVAWIVRHGMDKKHARDVRVTAVYWYWIAGVWIPLWMMLFPGPRFF